MARSSELVKICAAITPLLLLPAAAATAQDERGSPSAPTGVTEIVVRSGETPEEAVRSALAGVTSVELSGEVPEGGGLARLSMTLGLYARGPGPHRVPIGLDGLYPREAVADGRPLGWEAVPPEGWFVILPGGSPGEEEQRTVRVDVVAPIRSVDDRRVLSLSIPRHPNTRLRLDLPGPIAEATLGDGSLLSVEPIDDGRRSRIEAQLGARDELDVRWLPLRAEGTPLPPLLTGGGHIALDVDDGKLSAQSTWEIQVRRGEAPAVELVVDPADELLEVEVEGRPVAPEPAEDGIGLRIPLPRTLRKGDSARLSITTRRPIRAPADPDGLAPVSFGGHRFAGLAEQGGTLSISRADGLRILVGSSVGLRRIDPRDLREEIARTRPAIVSAFRFADQPFDLTLRVGPTPPMVRVAQRSLATLEPGGTAARIESWLDYRSIRGQLFSARVEVPEGLEVDRVGPPGSVVSWDLRPPGDPDTDGDPDPDPDAERAGGEDTPGGRATIELTLASPLREGQSTPTRIELSGRALLDPDRPGPVPIPLFLPTGAAFDGGLLAIAAPPDLEVTPAAEAEANSPDPGPGGGSPAPTVVASPPSTGMGPWSRPAGDAPRIALWLRSEAPAQAVPIGLSPRAPSSSSVIDQLVRVGRDGVDVQQDVTLYARDGELDRIDLAIPPGLERGWSLVDRGVVAEEEPIAPGPDGVALRRLRLAQPTAGFPLKLRISFRVPAVDRLEPGEATTLEIPRIEVRSPSPAAPPRVVIAAEPGLTLDPRGEGWRPPAENQWVTNPDGGPPLPIRHVWVRPPSADPDALPSFSATASTPAPLPETLASRLWIRSEQGPDGAVRTSCWFRFDDHSPTLGFQLPAAAELDRAYLDGQPLPPDDVDALDRPGAYLLHLPSDAARAVLVGLSYRVPRSSARSAWTPPALVGGGRVLETLWEVRIPWNRALVGVPGRFTDENLWYWGGYVWKRRPGMDPADLASWVAGPGASVDQIGPPLTAGRVGDHGYLFGRPGAPEPLGPVIASRATLVGACSGAVLLVGLLALVRRPWGRRAFPAAIAALLVLLMLVGRSTAALALQSSSVGWLLVAVAVLTRRAVDRRRPAGRFGEQSGLGTASGLGDSPSGGSGSGGSSPLVGSDDSTAIRPRPQPIGGPISPPALPPSPPPPSSPPSDPDLGRHDEVFDIPAPRADREAS
ncbi:hypothetical protein [Tautonia sociabilis]|uniref:Uncharacterized protein n=1 Tax=Tautonia sociabilis TaxID=2080755 RepID=A0A432MGI5_9BACT|nr:hypothetical protein [Tautonia sociabilis]RUL85846.1 hypothetical protein TsocGM_17660 [Tautonia sociabilis]